VLLASSAYGQSAIRWNAAEMGAKADGATDNTAVLQQALDAAGKAGGGIVELPAGRFRVNGNLSIPAGVTLQGTYRVPPTMSTKNEAPQGTILEAYAGRGSREGKPFILLAGCNSAIAGLVVNYPEWKQTDVPPVPYPPCVESHDTANVGVTECCFLNAYEAVKLVRAARHLVRNVTGYPICRGIYVDECYDIGRIENIHFWPFGLIYKHDDPYCKWINTQGIGIELARTDWQYVANTFCFGYGAGYKFSESKAGCANGNFIGLGADSCQRAVLVEQAAAFGLLITNGEFVGRWGSTDAVCVEVGPKVGGKVSLVNCAFWGPIYRCVKMQSPAGQFMASACNFCDYGGTPPVAIQLDAGKAIVQGCTFACKGIHVQAAKEVKAALLTGNLAEGGFQVDNQAGKRLQMAANEEAPEAAPTTPPPSSAQAATENSEPAAKPLPVIFDTDIGDDIDDTWALTMLLKSPQFDIKLITTTCGKAEYRTKLIAKMLTIAGRTDIPIGLGAGGREGTGRQAEWVKDYALRDYPGKIHEDGAKAIVETVNALAEKKLPLTIIAVGPLHTLEAALKLDPGIAPKADFVGMHGSVRRGYENNPTPCVEYNMTYVPGAQKVFTAPWRSIAITPLDTCGLVQFTGKTYARLKASDDPLLVALFENYRLWAKKQHKDDSHESTVLFDTVAVYLADAGPKPLLEMESLNIGVNEKGMMAIDPKGKLMNVATNWKNLDEYHDHLAKVLTAPTVKP
jgi:inosine-uridine nucleoside N-ribohydrolase